MPLAADAIRVDLTCGVGDGGRWHGWVGVRVQAAALRGLGLHPDQPSAAATNPNSPAWWHAAAERRAR
ncbi:hypothetical protein [Micromonospora sp. DT231]|uniref:hypothetical protein n=1 Tax=Micromonospora sp. DT231 TaxID=3416526 RepID=UPI003CF971DF